MRIEPEVRDFLEARGLRCVDDFFQWRDGQCLNKPGLESWRQRWRMNPDENSKGAGSYYLKRFHQPPAGHQWARWCEGNWRTSTAGVEAHNAEALAEAGVPAVRAAAWGQHMRGIWEVRSFVLLEEVPGQSLERWLPRALPPPEAERDWQQRHRRIRLLAEFIGRFHQKGFIHRDLYLAHVFIDAAVREASERSPLFTLIDLQRVFRPRGRLRRWVVKDLAALYYSAPEDRVSHWDRLRFLCRYQKVSGHWKSARALAAAVDQKADRMRRRRPAPLAGEWKGDVDP